MRAGVSVSVSQTLQSVRDFYQLNCLTRKRHGLPPQPWYFFEAVYRQIIKREMGNVFLARFGNHPVAGSIFFHFRKQAYFKYGASDHQFQRYRANNLVMWEAIQYYRALGYIGIDFGRTEIKHSGLRQFKRGWGAKEDRLSYYLYITKRKEFVSASQDDATPGYRLFRRMPIPLARIIGHFLYPHVG